MALIPCPECGRMVSPNAEECPGCGAPVKELALKQTQLSEAQEETLFTIESSPTEDTKEQVPIDPEKTETSVFPQPPLDNIESRTGETPCVTEVVDVKKKRFSTWIVVGLSVLLLLIAGGVGGWFYYNNVYLIKKRDAEAPRYYVMAQNLNIRSTPEFEADYNKIGSFPYGTEIIVYDSVKSGLSPYLYGKYAPRDARGRMMKDKCVEGYLSFNFMATKADFFLLNSIFGNEDARKMLSEVRYKKALLSYFKNKHYRGDINTDKMMEYGISSNLTNAPRWQVFCRYEKAKSNNVYRSRKYRKDSKYTDLAVIIKNLDNGERRLLYFVFDDDETFRLLLEQPAPNTGYMKDRTLKLIESAYGYYKVEVEFDEE